MLGVSAILSLPSIAKLARIPAWVWQLGVVAILTAGIYTKGRWDERAAWRDRVAVQVRENARISSQLDKLRAKADEAEQARREIEDQRDARLRNNDSVDLFPDEWLRDLNSHR